MMTFPIPPARQRGLTLVEMVLALVLLTALSAGLTLYLAQPLRAFDQMRQRSDLTSEAELAMNRMVQELRQALPGSIRECGSDYCLEFFRAESGMPFRPQNNSSDSYDLLLPEQTLLDFLNTATRLALEPSNINPGYTNKLYKDAADNGSGGVITPNSTTFTPIPGTNAFESQLRLSSAFKFDNGKERLYPVEGPFMVRCHPPGKLLTWHQGYMVTQNPILPSHSAGIRLGEGVTACRFGRGLPGPGGRDLIELEMTWSDGESTLRLYRLVLPGSAL